MTGNFKEIGSLFGREGAGAGFAKQTDKESFTYAFAWPEGDTSRTKAAHRFPKTRSVLPKNRVSVPCSSPPANLRAR